MYQKLGWINKLKFINEGGDVPPDPNESNEFTLIPDLTEFGVVGYIAGQTGSISGQPFPNRSNIIQIVADEQDFGLITIRFSGDAYEILNGTSLKIDGIVYYPYDEPNYDAGEDVTDMAYVLTDPSPVFVAQQQYTIEFIR